VKPTGPPDHDHVLTEVAELLRSHGLRRTPQRQATLEAVAEAAGHATPEEIARRVRRKLPAVSPSTVYRTLATLEEVGILCHAHLGHTASVYHVGTAGLHQHLVCEGCGALDEVDEALTRPFAQALRRRYGFRANLTHFAVLGECAACVRSGARERRPGARLTRWPGARAPRSSSPRRPSGGSARKRSAT
jgi:Fur family ferric uptake transcriptional regulator